VSDVALKIPGDSSSPTSLFILDATLFHSVHICMLRFLDTVRSLCAAAFRVLLGLLLLQLDIVVKTRNHVWLQWLRT